MERLKYLVSRFGMLIPFLGTVVCLLISKSASEPHAGNAEVGMWVFFGTFVVWLLSWVVRVAVNWFKNK